MSKTNMANSGNHVAKVTRNNYVKIGTIVLPAGDETACAIMSDVFAYLDMVSLSKVLKSSLVKQLCAAVGTSNFIRVQEDALDADYKGKRSIYELMHILKELYMLYHKCVIERPSDGPWPTSLMFTTATRRSNDVKTMLQLHKFHPYLQCKGSRIGCTNVGRFVCIFFDGDKDLKALVNEPAWETNCVGKLTILMTAVRNEDVELVKFLLAYGADASIAILSGARALFGVTALHFAASNCNSSTNMMELLLKEDCVLKNINTEATFGYSIYHRAVKDATPLDYCYYCNDNPSKQGKIALLRAHGGKANHFNENGENVNGQAFIAQGDLMPRILRPKQRRRRVVVRRHKHH
jgi:hypothetical protein